MIIQRTHTFPGLKAGYLCVGKTTTNSSGVGNITIQGIDYSSKIAGLVLTVIKSTASAVKCYNAYLVSASYNNGVTTIVIQANEIIDSGVGTTDITAYEGSVNYMFFLDDSALPTDLSTNNTFKQEY